MSYEDRVQELTYTTPSGAVLTCLYHEVPMKIDLRGREWGFPGLDGDYIQRTGVGSRVFRVECIFAGPDHDRDANNFENGILERGLGKLQPPYGVPLTVIPFGDFERLTRLVEGVNTTLITVSFYQTIDISAPRVGTNAIGTVRAKTAIFEDTQSKGFARALDVKSAQKELRAKNFFETALDTVKKGTDIAMGVQRAQRSAMQLQINRVNAALTTLVGNPLKVAFEAIQLAKLPGLALAALARRVAGYGNMIAGMLGLSGNTSPLPAQSRNELAITDLIVSGSVSGMATAVTEERYNTREEALSFAISLRTQADYVRTWRDDQTALVLSDSADGSDLVDTSDSAAALDDVVAAAIDLLVASSLDLPIRKTTTLTEPRGSLELCAELYGSVEADVYEGFIRVNRFTGSEILEIPTGRQVVSYG